MDIKPVSGKILRVANAMIGKSLLPNFHATDLDAYRVRVPAFDQLHPTLQRAIDRGRKHEMDMVRHQHKGMQAESSLPAIAI